MKNTLLGLKAIITFNQTGTATIEDIDAQSIEFLEKEILEFADEQIHNCINISVTSLLLSKKIKIDWNRY